MGAIDRTTEFRQLVKETREGIPEAKRRKLNKPSQRTTDGQKDGVSVLNKEYMTEGYAVVRAVFSSPTVVLSFILSSTT